MGLGIVDENLHTLLSYMQANPPTFLDGVIMYYAKIVGVCIALGVGANECYQMMLGRRGMDVMKILHIILISFCITNAGTIANMASAPGMRLEELAEDFMKQQNETIKVNEDLLNDLQDEYIQKVRDKHAELEMKYNAEVDKQSLNVPIVSDITDGIEKAWYECKNTLKEWAIVGETTICNWISIIVRWIGEILFQAMLYAVMLSQRIFSAILKAFAPLMFAISLSPHFKSAWSQWLSKYISLSLWGFIAYTICYYVFFIIDYNLGQDIEAFKGLNVEVNGDDILAIGLESLGTTTMYLVGCLIGIKCLASVSEVASWCIPGGVSSGSTGAMTGGVTGAAMTAGGAGAAIGGAAGGWAGAAAGSVGNQAASNMHWANYHTDQ